MMHRRSSIRFVALAVALAGAVAAVAIASALPPDSDGSATADAGTVRPEAAAPAAEARSPEPEARGPKPEARPASSAPAYDDWFTDEAMRVELYHSGGATDDSYTLDRVVREPLWPGMRDRLLDPTGFGKYRFRVEDAASGTAVFSQGYCTLLGEWQTTDAAVKEGKRRTLEESVRFPYPKAKVRVFIDRREDRPGEDGRGAFREIFHTEIDPASHRVEADARCRDCAVIPVRESGDPRQKIDILILGDGYTAAEMEKYRRDLRRFAEILMAQEAFARDRDLVNIWGLEAPSHDSGPDEPRKGLWHDTAFGTSFNTFDAERYLTTDHDRDLREIASRAPYDAIYILVNTSRYGGGGIYNQWAIFASDNEYDDYVFLHEFGHSFAGLADEYVTDDKEDDGFYPRGVEPWEPNITALLPGRRLKWAEMVAPGTPLPTPDDEAHAAVVGAFEGAGYQAKGLYRPYRDCKMFHKGLVPFCPVCARAFDLVIGLYAE